MKYKIEEQPDGTHKLFMYEEISTLNGKPTSAELEFWFEINRLRQGIKDIIRHQRIVGGSMSKMSTTIRIAESILNE